MEALEPRSLLAPIISEFQAINDATIADIDGDFSDWIEIRNLDAQQISLDGWFLTDDEMDLTKWRFPNLSVAGGHEVLVFASGKNRADPSQELHTNFRLSGDGEFLALIRPDGVSRQHDFGTKFPVQLRDQSYGLAAGAAYFFATPTPGAPNVMPAAIAPRIEGHQGVFFGSTTIELLMDAPAETFAIHYTLDGREPTRQDLLYTGPIVLSESAMLQARTFDRSLNPTFEASQIVSGTFVAVHEQLRERTSDIPLMIIDTLTKELSNPESNELVPTNTVLIEVAADTSRSSVDGGSVDYLGRAGARVRGSSTVGQPKTNMALETWGPNGSGPEDDFATNLLGMTAESDWVLHAPFDTDRALMRNQLAFQLSSQMGMWASDFRHVELYFNRDDGVVSEADYAGVYVLIEKIKQGPGRVDVADTTPQDNHEPEITGGYIWKIDRPDPDAPSFQAGGQLMNWVYPKSPESTTARTEQKATPQQQEWVVNHFDSFAQTLTSPDIHDAAGYSKYLDTVSWVDQHLLNVFLMNVDGLRWSAFLHKDRDGKIAYGPVWDFDRSAGSNDGRDKNPNRWATAGGTDFFVTTVDINQRQMWWKELFSDPGFWQLYVDRWQHWRGTVFGGENINRILDQLADELSESAQRNFERWPGVNPRSDGGPFLDGTFLGEVEHLRSWLFQRAAFMDANFSQPPEFYVDGQPLVSAADGRLSPGVELEILGPRLPFLDEIVLVSGQPGATSATYFIPTDDDLGQVWTKVEFDDANWSGGPVGLGFESQENFVDLIRTQVNPRDVRSTTIMARINFELTDLAEVQQRDLILKMKYDDGFIAYLNGEEVRRQGVRDDALTWNSRAHKHENSEAVEYEEFDLTALRHLLRQGENVLAIRGINASAFDRDMLLLPELVSRTTVFARNPAAKVYYTIDGTDPIGPDGTPISSALELASGERLSISQNTRVIARSFDESDRGPESAIVLTDWSSPVRFDIVVSPVPLVISEINYHPAPATLAELAAIPGLDDDDFEFIEIHNPGTTPAQLVGVKLSEGVQFDFTEGQVIQIDPRGFALVVNNRDAFELRYGGNTVIAGEFSGRLSNRGERIDLVDGSGGVLDTATYADSDPWPSDADGVGATLSRSAIAGPGDIASNWVSAPASPGSLTARLVGDANGDGVFDQLDIESVLKAGTYLADKPAAFSEGDWIGDRVFNQLDIVTALQTGNYLHGAVAVRNIDQLFATNGE